MATYFDLEWKIQVEMEDKGIRWQWRVYYNGDLMHMDYSDYKYLALMMAALWIAGKCAERMEAD